MMSVELSRTRTNLVVLAEELEISSSLLYRSRRELLEKEGISFPGNGKVILSEVEQAYWS